MQNPFADPMTAAWIVIGASSTVAGILTIILGPNLAYHVRRILPRERKKGGRPPGRKSPFLWALYGISVTTAVVGTAVATTYSGQAARSQEVRQASRLIAEEILGNIANMDARLGFMETVVAEDTFARGLSAVREEVAPALSATAEAGYSQLIAAEEVAALRQAFNSRPLRAEVGPSALPVLIDSRVPADAVSSFYDQLRQVEDASESLFRGLAEAGKARQSDRESTAYAARQVRLLAAVLRNRSNAAHVAALAALKGLRVDPAVTAAAHSGLAHLDQRGDVTDADLRALLQKYRDEAAALHLERKTLSSERERQRDELLERYASLDQDLQIAPTDTWDRVVAKAISLRQLGRTADAVAAFARYGEMFGPADSTAARYSRTAQQFTLQMGRLGVDGGVYVYEVRPEGNAARAGLRPGDIIVSFNREPVRNVPEMAGAQSETSGTGVPVTYLRLDGTGHFRAHEATLRDPVLAAGMMPI